MKPAIIRGWDLPKESYEEAHRNDGLVKLCIELSNVCNLSCPGCFTKRVEGGWNGKTKKRLPYEISYETQLGLLEEGAKLGVRTVDIVGAGEPTLDPRFYDIADRIIQLGMYVVVFTHGVTKALEDPRIWNDKGISFFLKLWSKNPDLQDKYVNGSIPEYTKERDKTFGRLFEEGLNKGDEVVVDGIAYKTSRIGADVLVMQSNYDEIPELLRFCREHNIMPIIKTYIPEGPTRFDQEQNLKVYSSEHLAALKKDEVSPNEFLRLRNQLMKIDREEFDIPEMETFYPQATKCTQSMASLYVTITGDIKSCVGTHFSYGKYEAGKDMLRKAIKARVEKVGFGCVPRLVDAFCRGLPLEQKLSDMYSDGMR